MMRKITFLFLLIAVASLATACLAAPTVIVSNDGRSNFSIVIPHNPQPALLAATRELQLCVELATGAKLPLFHDNATPVEPYISIGQTKVLGSSGIKKQVVEEGFHLQTHRGNLYIYGIDTPAGAATKNGGTSNGSANGVYSFLEQYLDVRWLMPGELGRDVPRRSAFSLPEIDQTQQPGFLNRRLPYIQDTQAVNDWINRQKLGFSFQIQHRHNWVETITPDFYQKNPEWFPLVDGKRQQPTGHYKLETTNPQLVRYFADRAIETLRKSSQATTFSLSPSDYETGWSQSPESQPYYDTLPNGEVSRTPLVLKFYQDVSQIVAREYPEGKLAGYIYSSYLYPPQSGKFTLPPNFYPVLAPSINYGYQLYRPDVQKEFDRLLKSWSKITDNLFYYDLPATLWSVESGSGGIITPLAPEILNTIFPRLVENKVKGVYIYGTDGWSQAAATNYIMAKMMWDPQADAYALKSEWLERAYGKQAAAILSELYQNLDQWFREYHLRHNGAEVQLRGPLLKEVYGVHYPQIEKAILAAKAATISPSQRKRFELLENNIIVLQSRLKDKGLLPAHFQSSLDMSEPEIIQLLTQQNADFDLYPGLVDSGPKVPAVKVSLGQSPFKLEQENIITVRNKNRVLLHALQDGEISINPLYTSVVKPFLNYAIKDQGNKPVKAGILKTGEKIRFKGQANRNYFLYIPSGVVRLSVQGAAVAYQTDLFYNRLHVTGKSEIYIYNPREVTQWKLTLSTGTPTETARVRVTAPNGEHKTTLETIERNTDAQTLVGSEGFWKIEVEQAASGTLDDVYLTFDAALPQWASIDPQHPLIVGMP